VREILHKVEHPTLPVDPLFYEDITPHKLAGEIKNTNSDKSPGDDGITKPHDPGSRPEVYKPPA